MISQLYEDYEVNRLPIDVFELANKMEIILIPYSNCSLEKQVQLLQASDEGMSCFDHTRGNRFVIYYNDNNRNKQRIRFTIMHEIGHIVLEHKESCEQTESEADFFARNALAPLPIIISNKIYDLEKIVSTFDISYSCAGNVSRTLATRLEYGYDELLDYELTLVQQFK